MATWPQTKIVKMHVGAMDSAGMPDIHVQSRGRGGVWLELKFCEADEVFDWSKQPTLLQKNQLRELYYAGARVGVIVFFEEWWCAVHGRELMDAFIGCVNKWDSSYNRWGSRYLFKDSPLQEFAKLVWGER